MANFFSDAMAPTPTSAYDASYRRPGAAVHARLRKKRAAFTLTAASLNDTVVLATLKSSDRIYDMRVSQTAGAGAGSIAVGAYYPSLDHNPANGTLLQNNIFMSGVAVTGALARVDALTNGAVIANVHRGLPLWQMIDLGTPVITKDPMRDIDIVLLYAVALTGGQPMTFEFDYVSFG